MKMEWIISIAISAATTLLGFFVKYTLFKESVATRIASVEKVTETLQAENKEFSGQLLVIHEKLTTIDEHYKELKKEMRAENEKTNSALNENTKAINKLQGTLEGLTQILKRKQ